jgi:hypothetical protein
MPESNLTTENTEKSTRRQALKLGLGAVAAPTVLNACSQLGVGLDEIVAKGSSRISDDFMAQILNSETSHGFLQAITENEWELLKGEGRELFYDGVGPNGGQSRHALLPISDGGVRRLGYMYTYDPVSGRDGADIFEIIENEENNLMRFYMDPSFGIYADFVFQKDGTFVTILASSNVTDYLTCFIRRALILSAAASGGNPVGAATACITACAVVTNPLCLACLAISIGIALAAWWDC